MLRTTTLLITSLLILIPAQAQDCERSTDEFTGKTTVECDNQSVDIEEQPMETITQAYIAAITDDEMNHIYLSVVALSESWNWLNTDDAYFLAGGDRYRFDVVPTAQEAQSGHVLEQIVVKIPKSDAREITTAGRMKIGQAVLQMDALPGQLREALRLSGE